MLLPSALPCDARPHHSRTHDFFTTPPPSHASAPASPLTTGIYTTCRALQTLLSGPTSTTPPQSPPPRDYKRTLQSPITIKRTLHRAHPTPRPPPPRSATKRRRDPLDDDGNRSIAPTNRYTTPKRARLAPPVLPLGLSSSDFESPSHPQPTTPDFPSPTNPSDVVSASPAPGLTTSTGDWSPSDERALVALVLSKIRLSRREWNECARRLGRDGAGVGARWRVLVGEGRVGMRMERERGKGLGT